MNFHSAHIFAEVYVAVILAELIGDKTLYTIGSLSTQFSIAPLLIGVSAAFAIKAIVAVIAGRWISTLPQTTVNAITAATCFIAAVAILIGWRFERPESAHRPLREATISCSTVLFSEWGDPGQLVTALAAIRLGTPILVCTAATAAMMTKAVVMILCGRRLHTFVTPRVLQGAAFTTCVVVGVLAAVGVR
jgi:putative Ca2+/H+ antiporter (TMEM165/GDT1 family)